jgi:hypothetical protein
MQVVVEQETDLQMEELQVLEEFFQEDLLLLLKQIDLEQVMVELLYQLEQLTLEQVEVVEMHLVVMELQVDQV